LFYPKHVARTYEVPDCSMNYTLKNMRVFVNVYMTCSVVCFFVTAVAILTLSGFAAVSDDTHHIVVGENTTSVSMCETAAIYSTSCIDFRRRLHHSSSHHTTSHHTTSHSTTGAIQVHGRHYTSWSAYGVTYLAAGTEINLNYGREYVISEDLQLCGIVDVLNDTLQIDGQFMAICSYQGINCQDVVFVVALVTGLAAFLISTFCCKGTNAELL